MFFSKLSDRGFRMTVGSLPLLSSPVCVPPLGQGTRAPFPNSVWQWSVDFFLREENWRTWRITRRAKREPETNSNRVWFRPSTICDQPWREKRSHDCAIRSPQMINYWSIWLQNWDLILLCFRTQENPVLWDKKDCSWRSEARFLHENSTDNSQSCR